MNLPGPPLLIPPCILPGPYLVYIQLEEMWPTVEQ